MAEIDVCNDDAQFVPYRGIAFPRINNHEHSSETSFFSLSYNAEVAVILSAGSARRLLIKVVTVPIVSDSQSRSDLLGISGRGTTGSNPVWFV